MSTIKQLAPMRRRLCFHHLLTVPVLLLAAAAVQECAAQGGGGDHAPLVSPLAKDPATSLYTISIKDGAGPLVVDLADPLVWSACASGHPTFPCGSAECDAANSNRFCWQQDYGAGAEVDGGDGGRDCTSTARPCDPVTRGRCAPGDLTTFAMSANATDGRNALYPVPFQAVGACSPDQLLRSLPASAAGVAGFRRAPLSLPAQLSARRGFGRRFALCLPGVAIFGDTPIHLGYYPPDLLTTVASTPLAANPKSGGYYLPVEAISVSWPNWDAPTARAALPPDALELDAATGRGGVTLSTVQRYTAMRPDVYRAFVRAFNETIGAPGYVKPMPAVAPFELCYDTFSLRHGRVLGWDVPSIRLELGAGASMNWTVASGNSMVQAADRTLCLAVVEMGGPGAAAPAVVIGGYQVEDNLLVFDEDEEVLHFSGLLWGSGATCSGFNFTAPQ
ncbi:chitinase CLP-like [Panicum virgatum]|nr:chitinase CLP-like [Panicum virgatum]